jgi:hypothetical protein
MIRWNALLLHTMVEHSRVGLDEPFCICLYSRYEGQQRACARPGLWQLRRPN